jgi:3-oxoadipate enol-lactonase
VTLLFVHGAGCTRAVFREQLTAFPDAIAVDLPGHGAPGSADSIPAFADAIAAKLEAEDLRDVVIIGHSMGGAVALELALRKHPRLVAIGVLGCGVRLRVAPAVLAGLENDFEGAGDAFAGLWFADPDSPLRPWAVSLLREVGREQTLADLRACDRFDIGARIGEVRLPILALTGESDRLTPPKYAALLGDRVAGAQVRIVPGAGHFVMVEQPAVTNAALGSFVSRVSYQEPL